MHHMCKDDTVPAPRFFDFCSLMRASPHFSVYSNVDLACGSLYCGYFSVRLVSVETRNLEVDLLLSGRFLYTAEHSWKFSIS